MHAEETKLDILQNKKIFIHRSELCIKMCHRFEKKKKNRYVDLPVRWFRVLRK